MSASVTGPADSRLAHVTGVVLCAGGAEALHGLRFGSHSLGERVASLLAHVVRDVVWVGAPPPPGAPGRAAGAAPQPLAASEHAALCAAPCAALCAALEVAPEGHVLVVSADRPLLSPDLVIGLAGRPAAQAVVPRGGRGPEPLCARYDSASLLPELRRCMAEGEGERFLERVPVEWLEGEALAALDGDGTALRRVGSRAELERLARNAATAPRGLWPGHPGLAWTARPSSVGQSR